MRSTLKIACIFLAAFLALPTNSSAATPKKKKIDQIAAVVGSKIILLSEVKKKAGPAIQELNKAGSSISPVLLESKLEKIYKETLDQIIDDELVKIEARELELTVETEEIDRSIMTTAKEQGVDLETIYEAVRAQGMEVATYRDYLRSQLLRYKVLSLKVRTRVKITDVEARQYYNSQVREVRATGSFEGAHILIRLPSDAGAAQAAETRKRAEDILARLKAGRSFEKLAEKLSEDKATAEFGGSLGQRQPGEIPSVLENVFMDMEVGELAGPVRTPAGYHILKLNDREALGVQPFQEVKGRILAQLSQEEMLRQEKIWLKELRKKTFIDIRM